MRQYEMFELSFEGPQPEESEALTDITAEFTCGEDTWKVKGFYDGNKNYKVRFLPQKLGTYTWKVSGVVSEEGSEECTSSEKAMEWYR